MEYLEEKFGKLMHLEAFFIRDPKTQEMLPYQQIGPDDPCADGGSKNAAALSPPGNHLFIEPETLVYIEKTADLTFRQEAGLTWAYIFQTMKDAFGDLNAYTKIGFEYEYHGCIMSICGHEIPDKTVYLINIDICEPTVAGGFFSYKKQIAE